MHGNIQFTQVQSRSQVPPTPVFQNARQQIEQGVNSIVSSLNKKRTEMFTEIDRLEKEFVDSYRHKQTELNKLQIIQKQTRQLSEDIISTMQQTIAKELEQGIRNMSLEIQQSKTPSYNIDLEWGMCLDTLLQEINQSHLCISNPNILLPRSIPMSSPTPTLVDYPLIRDSTIPNT